ncbi:MAG: YlxR family protein [Chloroflexi bacterium]|nr:YlxR family protein [Chloroflexota bacterium]
MAKLRHIPERTCVGCGQKRPKRELVRVVRTPQGGLLLDTTGKTPGRGAYLCHHPMCWKKGTEKGNIFRRLNLDPNPADLDRLYSEFQAIGTALSRES